MMLRLCRDMRSAAVLFGLGLGLVADPAASQPTQAQQNAIRSNCRSDYMANCSSVKPGGMEALQCLQRNVAKLSPACQSAVKALSPASAPTQHATPAPAPAPAAAPATAAAPPPAAAPADTPTAAHPPATHQPAAPAPAKPTQTAKPAPATKPAPAAAPAAPSAPTPQQQAAIRNSCQSDFMARCRGVQPGGADALRCLQRNSAQLSPACRSAVAALGGGGAPTAATAPTTAAAPPAAMPTPAQQSAIRFSCRADFRASCRGVPEGGPEALACLQRNAARLSPDCRTALAAIADDAPTTAANTPSGRPLPPGPFPIRRAIRERLLGGGQ